MDLFFITEIDNICMRCNNMLIIHVLSSMTLAAIKLAIATADVHLIWQTSVNVSFRISSASSICNQLGQHCTHLATTAMH